MKTRSATTILIVLAGAAVAGALANHLRLERQRALAPIKHLRTEDETARTLNRARMRLAAAELARDAERDALLREGTAFGSIPPAGRPPTPAEVHTRMLHDPDVQFLGIEARRAVRKVQYEALVRQLGLSPDQADAFARLIAERDTQEMDLVASARAQSLRADDPAFAALVREHETDTEKALRDLLGEDRYATFQQYERTSALRLTVSSLAAAATVAGEALSQEQAENLVQILAESCPKAAAHQRLHPSNIDWSLADPRIKAILTPAQWDQIRWTEPSGPMGYGGRFFPRIDAAISAAYQADAAEAAASTMR